MAIVVGFKQQRGLCCYTIPITCNCLFPLTAG